MPEHTKTAVDLAAGFITLATIAEWLPYVAAGLSAIWTVIRITEWAITKFRKNKCSEPS